jgi:hypothetical protein
MAESGDAVFTIDGLPGFLHAKSNSNNNLQGKELNGINGGLKQINDTGKIS